MSLRRTLAISTVVVLLFAQVAHAYEHPLNERSVNEAYSLGHRHDPATSKFLEKYFKRLPQPRTGPYISDIEILTPYVQAVWRAHDNPMTYSESQAEKDYADPYDVLLVRVRITFTPSYPGYVANSSHKGQFDRRSNDFWKEFTIRILQGSEVASTDASFSPVYSYSDEGPQIWIGGDLTLKLDGSQLSSDPVRIEVLTPDGQTVKAEFDLGALR